MVGDDHALVLVEPILQNLDLLLFLPQHFLVVLHAYDGTTPWLLVVAHGLKLLLQFYVLVIQLAHYYIVFLLGLLQLLI